MRRALLLLLLAAPAAAGTDPEAERRVFLELATPRSDAYVGEAVRVTLRVGLDRAFFRQNAVPLFARGMDFPVHVEAGFLAKVAGATVLPGEPPAAPVRTLGINDSVAGATEAPDRLVDGRPFAVLEVTRTLVPEAAGKIEIPAPVLRFAHATAFEEDFLRGRRALDRRDAVVTGLPLRLLARPVPEEGRPASFTGAIGRFAVASEAAPRRVAAGETLRLVLRVTGEGNLARFAPPRLDDLPGFHVYGVIDETVPGARSFTYDLAALSPDVARVPAIPFAFLDPSPPATFRVARTEPIPIEVRPGPGVPAARDPAPRDTQSRGGLWLPLLAVVLLATGGAAAAGVRARRARARRVADEKRARHEGVAAALAQRTATEGADLAAALVSFLAFHLRCPEPAVISPDLGSRLRAAGVPAPLAERTAALLDRLMAARYGGRRSLGDAEETRRVGEALAATFRRATTGDVPA